MFATKAKDPAYEKKKIREADRQRKIAASGRDIGELPPVKNQARKDLCECNFRLFCELYFKDVFTLAWSLDHLEVIAAIQTTVLEGGLFALAMPRGSGKTSLCEIACVWAALYGHHKFILLIGADAEAASDSLEAVRTYLETNETLAEDFPEVCHPLKKLEGIQQRRLLYRDQPIKIKFTKTAVVLPDMPGSKSASVIFRVAGITGRIRGMKFVRRDKTSVRPSLCLIDDPQTDESAGSDSMCKSRERVLSKAVRGLAGPGKKIAALMPCTVIRRNDMADRLLNRQIHPAWHGRRFKLVYEWPKRMDLWEKYITIRYDCQREDKPTTRATKFYRENFEEMNDGFKVAWPERFEPDEISAYQNCINLRYESPDASEESFLCEYQNEPPDLESDLEKLPTVEELQAHEGPYPRQALAPEVAHVFAQIDVQETLLYWQAAGVCPNFTSYIMDYQTWPPQKVTSFTLKGATETLATLYPKANTDGRIYQGLTDLVAELLKMEFKTETGQTLRVEKIGIDASFKTSLIHRFCRESDFAAMLFPTHGKGIKATQKPLRYYKTEPGEKLYELCMLAKGRTKARTTRHYLIDTNAVKTFLFERFATTIGDAGSIQLYKGHPTRHKLYCEHLLGEFRQRVTYEDRTVDHFQAKPGKPDNHYLDTLGIFFAMANAAGCRLDLPGSKPQPKKARKVKEAEYL